MATAPRDFFAAQAGRLQRALTRHAVVIVRGDNLAIPHFFAQPCLSIQKPSRAVARR
ncbi:hypothetical protein H4V98_001405 [Polaromonas sp. CG_23.6]|nr:hypothetical protein [Polaromonas sp. CG_23.6]